MTIEKHKVPVDGLWHACPSCSHDSGWHVFFKKASDPGRLQLLLQCPNCKAQMDLGLQVMTNP
ncbi:MAG: hypothetical protein JXL80_03975 [Planctomycetes bacterium]|nr:hypothetical protein [Planctomycetota bacterium]